MSYANGTTHYNLPQTVGTDKRDWSDTNQAFNDLDAAVYGAVQDVATAGLDIDSLETRMDTAEGNIATNAGDISALDTRLTTAEGAITQHASDIADVRSDCEDMICAYNEATATSTHAYVVGDYFIYNNVLYRATSAISIGDTIVPDTNCTTTNVTTEILGTKGILIAQAASDGVRTKQAIVNDLYTQITINPNGKYRLLVISGVYVGAYSFERSDDTSITLQQTALTNTALNVDTITIAANSNISRGVINSGGFSYTDRSSEVQSSGVTYELYETV